MGSMRQRLLLVAGWVAAAVVASLVSTGAVAVAGGQVTDRPLRPLSASEVAALTEECGSTDRAPCLRQLEKPVELTTLVEAAPDLNSSLDGDGQGVSPTAPEPSLPPEDDPLDPADEPDESLVLERMVSDDPDASTWCNVCDGDAATCGASRIGRLRDRLSWSENSVFTG